MGNRELRAKYGGNSAQAMNRAIRAEIPGGARLFDALQAASQNRSPREILTALVAAKDEMRDFLASKYEIGKAE